MNKRLINKLLNNEVHRWQDRYPDWTYEQVTNAVVTLPLTSPRFNKTTLRRIRKWQINTILTK